MHTSGELVSAIARVATLPTVYVGIKRVIDDPNASLNDVAKAISVDPGITVRLLTAVNSALCGFPRRVETVSRALSLLGMQQVHDLVLATSLATAFAGIRPKQMDMLHFWRGSVSRALAARALARRCGSRAAHCRKPRCVR